MTVIIAVASKHGATTKVGEAIAEELAGRGIEADVFDVSAVSGLDRYSAVVLGSAVYMGRLMPQMRRFAEENQAALRAKTVWAFASGPIGDPPKPSGDAPGLLTLAEEVGAVGVRTFAGRLAPDGLGFKERLVVKVVHAQTGDFRDWDGIAAWAAEIAESLRQPAIPAIA